MNKLLFVFLLLNVYAISWAQEETTDATDSAQTQVLPAVDVQQSAQDIQTAYKREYSFLTEQVKSLKDRIAEFKLSSASDNNRINENISQLESKILQLEKIDNQYQDDIFAMQRNSESATDNNNLLAATITQAQSTLTEYDFTGFGENSELSDIEKITQLVNNAADVLKSHASVSKSQGEFFLQNGKQVNGTIIKIGNIASYASSELGGGTLAPAGEGKFKVWQAKDAQIVADFVNGTNMATMPIFLYESSIKSIEEKQQKTIRSVIDSGGIIAWIIVFLGIFALALILLRIWFLQSSSTSTEKVLNKVVYNIEQNDMDHAIKVAKNKKSSSARVLQAVLRNISKDREHIEDIVSETILHESAQLNRFGSLIMVVATVSPLLGLLGTVTGMISTFDIITEFGTGDPKLLSSGISVALVTTEVGLAVAIPALLFGNVLSGWAERIKDDMEKAALRVINVYKKTKK